MNNAEGLAKIKDILENPSNYAGYTVYIIEDIDLSDLAETYKEDISLPSIRFENKDGAVVKGLNVAPFKIKVSMYEGEYRTMQLLNPVNADNGWYKNEDGGYLYMKNSRAAKGWFQDKTNKAWYYLKPTNYGIASVGWEKIDGDWYYFNSQCVMLTGWQSVNGSWYYMDDSGVMLTGWQFINGNWYYLSGSGAMVTGWAQIGGKWYYFNGSGAMVTGWAYINGSWYYMSGNGAMVTGWAQISGKWYYFNGSGAMLTGWQQIGGNWYYLSDSGAMLTGTQRIGGKTYRFNSSGAWVA